ncbi:unnamed protein product [Sphagnum jensenii]|uniref:Transcription repressor n=1 Tax=Sphagnum jensenii TaxID=128206 RepID=A0ABP1ARX6_9BRYO
MAGGRSKLLWQDDTKEVRQMFGHVRRLKHNGFSGFSMWDENVPTAQTLSRNRLRRRRAQFAFDLTHLNYKEAPFEAFTHLHNIRGMCNRIQSQDIVFEKRRRPILFQRPTTAPNGSTRDKSVILKGDVSDIFDLTSSMNIDSPLGMKGVHTHLHSKHDDAHHQNEKPMDKNAIVVKGVSDYLAFNNESLHKDSKVNKSMNLCSKMGGKTHSKQNLQVIDNTCENGTKKNPTLVNRAQNLQPSKTQIVNKKQRRRKNNGTSQLGMPTTSIDASTNGALGWGKRMQLGTNERNNNNMMRSMSKVVEDSHVLVKQSMNPYFDFKHSMMLMIREEHLETQTQAMEELFKYYLDINPPVHHVVIKQVIKDIRKHFVSENCTNSM